MFLRIIVHTLEKFLTIMAQCFLDFDDSSQELLGSKFMEKIELFLI